MKNLTPAKLIVMMMVAMGLLVALYVGKQLLAKEPPPPRTIGTRVVTMLVGDVEVGTVLTQEHIGMGPWPANEIRNDVLLNATTIVGRVELGVVHPQGPGHPETHGQLGRNSSPFF